MTFDASGERKVAVGHPAGTLLPRGSDSVLDFRCVIGRFTFVHLLNSHLPAS